MNRFAWLGRASCPLIVILMDAQDHNFCTFCESARRIITSDVPYAPAAPAQHAYGHMYEYGNPSH